MILERIVLHNFGPYLGRQEIDLSPRSAKKPVILFGGMNGGGKTTLLTALQLVLYGRQAPVWRSSQGSYETYLRKMIHKRADVDEGAGLELVFTSSAQGAEQTLHLCRYWRVAGAAVKESLDVIRDGEIDTVLAENWSEWVEEFIPVRVAPLFFFDGEKIEELADPAKSAQILESAIHSLLGLDLVDQLKTDLEILERRKRKEGGDAVADADAAKREDELARDVAKHEERVGARHQELAGLTNELNRIQKRLADVSQKLAKEGGNLFEHRHKFESEREAMQRASGVLEEELRSLAAGGLPLAMLVPQLEFLERQSRASSQGSLQSTLVSVLEQRDASLLSRAQALKASKALLASMAAFLAEDRRERAVPAEAGAVTLDSGGMARVHALQSHVLPTELVRVRSLLKKLDEHDLQVQALDRRLAGLPDEEQILPLLQERDRLRDDEVQLTRKCDGLTEALRLESQELERLKKQLADARQAVAESMLDGEDTKRVLQHSGKARDTLAKFRQRVLGHHVQRIERLAMESFHALMRKQCLIHDLRIDPATFAVTLRGEDGHDVATSQLSAGERQLLAIAILWGLGRASGRPLPTVIDTPLGRLDSSHRRNLIERYYPYASHQVILLSTDEEIDERYLRDLMPHITRTYLLDFDDRKQVTTVKDGYFWEVA